MAPGRHTGLIAFALGLIAFTLGGCESAPAANARPSATAPSSALTPKTSSPTDDLMRRGSDAYSRGDIGAAAEFWDHAAAQYRDAGQPSGQCDAMLDRATALEAAGSFADAASVLTDALAIAQQSHDRDRQVDLLNALASVYTFTRSEVIAQRMLDEGMALAKADHNSAAIIRLTNNRGNLFAVLGKYDAAAQAYSQAATMAHGESDLSGEARATTNEALALLNAHQVDAALDTNRAARSLAARLPAGHDSANLDVAQGRMFWLARSTVANDKSQGVIDEASASFSDGARIAESNGDRLMLSYALGYQGEIAEKSGKDAEAISLSRRAMFLAQEAQSPAALYLWQWQIGRVLWGEGKLPQAIDAYAGGIETLQKIHGDLANGFGNQVSGDSFRESVGPIYYQMADVLLRRADEVQDDKAVQRLLLQARDTIELLKSGELEDYFQQKCVNLLQRSRIEDLDPGTAVVYLIPLPDRLEMLISTSIGTTRKTSPIGSEQMTAEVREFRDRLEDRTSNRYLTNARKLYDWIIRPILPTLADRKVNTLVFVPDGALRTIPMSALNDGKDFLIANYAVAITPGLTLITPAASGSVDRHSMVVLEGGLSQSVSGFPPLEYVPRELNGIHRAFGGTQLLNQTFTQRNLTGELRDHSFDYVHLASHAEFSHDQNNTFLLTFPDANSPTGSTTNRLTLPELGRLLNATRYRERPVELLALSACQTAAGDDRAALGLAGIAIEMGARSAVATLWSVNDQASAELIERFYALLAADPSLTKARAMQRAQLDLIADVRYHHPAYWAPYLVIGNWTR